MIQEWWLAFFDDSNPFIEISVEDDVVIGVTTYNDEWRFPLLRPEQVVVDKL